MVGALGLQCMAWHLEVGKKTKHDFLGPLDSSPSQFMHAARNADHRDRRLSLARQSASGT
jgi:hypothetical protein